ncbi:hypothetical protein VZ94_21210 [Methylocucumis oryzae]|uniref:Uncharacterized protein n=1 Tax=Methylocucumis oryzae TaxID=1632867 RepID=A0A0F3IEA1_9GAMM|nr:hypothetical protein VZ94_21210 [Methylocucumis oryzae]
MKTLAQQDIQLVHNIRQGLVEQRTALVNQLRGTLSERGIILAEGIKHVRQELPLILENAANGLTTLSRELIAEQYQKLNQGHRMCRGTRRINRGKTRTMRLPSFGTSYKRTLWP